MKQAQKARKVEPIRRKADIERIKTNLADQPRNLALFVFGINTNLRASDIIRITVDQVKGIKPGETIDLIEKKTKKPRCITINPGTADANERWLKKRGDEPGPLFLSQRIKGKAICATSIHRLVKSWCKQINIKGNYGSHTLRKTWGYHAWKAGIDIPILMTIFNHSSQRQTLQYLCIQEKEIQEVYLKVEL